jgi:hypothetical protein
MFFRAQLLSRHFCAGDGIFPRCRPHQTNFGGEAFVRMVPSKPGPRNRDLGIEKARLKCKLSHCPAGAA